MQHAAVRSQIGQGKQGKSLGEASCQFVEKKTEIGSEWKTGIALGIVEEKSGNRNRKSEIGIPRSARALRTVPFPTSTESYIGIQNRKSEDRNALQFRGNFGIPVRNRNLPEFIGAYSCCCAFLRRHNVLATSCSPVIATYVAMKSITPAMCTAFAHSCGCNTPAATTLHRHQKSITRCRSEEIYMGGDDTR